MSPQQAATFIREQIPAGGLFAGLELRREAKIDDNKTLAPSGC
jgi:hypothetical protein